MAAPAQSNSTNAIPPDTLITIKVSVNDGLKKLKLPLRDLGANVLPDKLRHLLGITPEQTVTFERFSDSAGGYISLDPNNPQVFKTLIRAAKAKLKLRLKATVTPVEGQENAVDTNEKIPQKAAEPLIVRSPDYQSSPRDSTALDRRSIGSGIFEFKEARASQQTLVDTSEAPVPRPFSMDNKSIENKNMYSKIADRAIQRGLAFRTQEPAVVNNNGHPWSVYCNECDDAMIDAHFHCSICDGGDYDLCERCVTNGKLCPGEGHWLIKRFIKDGKVINSTTERISPRKVAAPVEPVEVEAEKEIPGAFTEDTKTLAGETIAPTRTCNSCVIVLGENQFVTCTTCEDFDLCIQCHTSNKHGHHPAHAFKPATDETVLPITATTLLAPGRNVRHNAICDGCDKKIWGVRHKCLNCPDWDFCDDCVKDARHSHPRHRFAALYQPIPEAQNALVRHHGIYCDGPLCDKNNKQQYMTGVRYKCAVCHDTDFCAACEAHPSNTHNRTHPLIKFKTPVRNVSITTENDDLRGNTRIMGDRRPEGTTKTASTETTPVELANAATQVQTMAEIKPTEEKTKRFKIEPKSSPVVTPGKIPASLLNAHFVGDSIPDGKVMEPGFRFTQVWTMRNPGPYAWPNGCSVRFVGGDNMLNVDNDHPAAVSDINNASESNVVGRAIGVGEQVAFKVTLKAPTREGKSISYWRMKAADGTPFGHRLWCDIEVKKPVEAVPIEPQVVSALPPVNAPFKDAQQAQLSRMQAIRQQQAQQMQHQQMLRGQQAAAQQQLIQQEQQRQQAIQASAHQQWQDNMSKIQQQQEKMKQLTSQAMMANNNNNLGQPPAYDATSTPANISARIAAMREQQAKRREHMMAQFNAHREQFQGQGVEAKGVADGQQRHIPIPINDSTTFSAQAAKAREEAARARVENMKSKIMLAREQKEKAVAAAKEAAAKEQAEEKKSVETEKVKKIIEEVTKDAEQEKNAENLEGSQMVFPKLEKESPSSSTYQSATSSTVGSGKGKAAYVENEAGEVERSASPAPEAPAAQVLMPEVTSPAIEEDFEDLNDDDLEVLSADGDETEEDGFQTDEEYDILDASDQETVASK